MFVMFSVQDYVSLQKIKGPKENKKKLIRTDILITDLDIGTIL